MSQSLNIRQALEKYGKIVHPIKGTSMLPMLDEDKDAVEIVPIKGPLQLYDLTLFERPDGQLVLHRIIAVRRKFFLICGDNSIEVEKVPLEWIVGVAQGFYKNGTYVSCQNEQYISYVHNRWKDYSKRELIKKVPKECTVTMALYRAAITGRDEEIQTTGNLVWERVYNHCQKMMIGAVVCAVLDKVNCPKQIQEKFKQLNQQGLRRWLLFQAERETICQALEQKNIPYMFLKGIRYAPLYPFPGAREMADNDILIRPEHAQIVKRYMTEHGYKYHKSWIHESYCKKPLFNFEFHTKLFWEDSVNGAFCDVWNRAKQVKDGGCEFLMLDEDLYLHTVAHFHKHYVDGGAGLRAFADLYLLRKNSENYDRAYIDRKLEEMGLREFAAFYEETTQLLFDGDLAAIPFETVQYIFDSGAFGSFENRAQNAIARDGKKKYLWRRLFLPYPNMCIRYPCLCKLPFLLPVFWVVRWTNPLFSKEKRRRLKIQLAAIIKSKNSKKKNG